MSSKADNSFRDQQTWSFQLEGTMNVSEKPLEAVSMNSLLREQLVLFYSGKLTFEFMNHA